MALEELEVEAWQFRELSRHPETAPFLHALKIIHSVHSSFLYFHHANRCIIAKIKIVVFVVFVLMQATLLSVTLRDAERLFQNLHTKTTRTHH